MGFSAGMIVIFIAMIFVAMILMIVFVVIMVVISMVILMVMIFACFMTFTLMLVIGMRVSCFLALAICGSRCDFNLDGFLDDWRGFCFKTIGSLLGRLAGGKGERARSEEEDRTRHFRLQLSFDRVKYGDYLAGII